MISGIKNVTAANKNLNKCTAKTNAQNSNSKTSNELRGGLASAAAGNAIRANALNLSSTINFTGALYRAFEDLNQIMQTCKTKDKNGENVGSRANINKLIFEHAGDFNRPEDAIKTTIDVGKEKIEGKEVPVRARTQIKLLEENEGNKKVLFEMAVREPSLENTGFGKSENLKQLIDIEINPINHFGDGTREQVYILNTKGNLMAVIEDGDNVLLTNAGKISKKDNSNGFLKVAAQQRTKGAGHINPMLQKEAQEIDGELVYSKDNTIDNIFIPFTPEIQEVEPLEKKPSIGTGGRIVIGLENERFVKENIKSIMDFKKKIDNNELILRQFVANPNAQAIGLILLAGGYGSRAEYTNAASSAIFHDKEGGAQSTKGIHQTATGQTPMETTLITLHNTGFLDCNNLKVGDNLVFYVNKDKNKGNGGYTLDLFRKTKNADTKAQMIFSNDAMSRLSDSYIKAADKLANGSSAITLIAKEVPSETAINNFGIMRLNEDDEILEFAEKPPVIPEGFEVEGGNCLTNTFHFGVSNEVFDIFEILEPYFSKTSKAKETRDWSKQYIPIIKTLSQNTDYNIIRKDLKSVMGNDARSVEDYTIRVCQNILNNKKVHAVPTTEPWADCGTLNQLYHTMMQIVSGDFPLEDFERAHAQACVNTQTGLIASSPEQKAEIESKYDIDGQVMVVPKAAKVTNDDIEGVDIVVNEPKKLSSIDEAKQLLSESMSQESVVELINILNKKLDN